MELHLRHYDCGPCPYLEAREWRTEQFSASSFDPEIYESLLGLGFRRSAVPAPETIGDPPVPGLLFRLSRDDWRQRLTLPTA